MYRLVMLFIREYILDLGSKGLIYNYMNSCVGNPLLKNVIDSENRYHDQLSSPNLPLVLEPFLFTMHNYTTYYFYFNYILFNLI